MADDLRLTLNSGQRLLKTQQSLIESRALVCATLGGWGSGKTLGAAMAFLLNCLRPGNGWNPSYGDDLPFSLVVAPTFKVLKDSSYREFMSVCPRELIRKRWQSPDLQVLLCNGHMVKFRTIRGSLEGASAVGIWVDEIHLVKNEAVWLNYQARAREPRAAHRRVIASGLPESGWLQGVFGSQHDADPNRYTVFCKSADNHYLPPEVIEQFRASAPGSQARCYLDGQWITSEDRVYYEFSPDKHMVARPADRRIPVQIGLDIGDQSAVIFAQRTRVQCKSESGRPFTAEGLHVVDEIHPMRKSTEVVCREIRARGWIINDASALFVDPTTRRDELDGIRRVFPTIQIIKKSRKGRHDSVEPGHAAINCALSDADGNVRLTFDQALSRQAGTVYHSMLNFKRLPNGRVKRDDKEDHSADALRYVVAHFLPVARAGHSVHRRV